MSLTRDYYAEEVDHLTSFGESHESILERLGVSATALAKALRRADRPELARPFERIRNQQRAAGRVCECGNPIKTHTHARCFACGHKVRMVTRYGSAA